MEENKPLTQKEFVETTKTNETNHKEQKTQKIKTFKKKITTIISSLRSQLKEEDEEMAAMENELESEPLPKSRKKLIGYSCAIIVLLMGLVYFQFSNDQTNSKEPQFEAPTISPIESDESVVPVEFTLETFKVPLELYSNDGKTLTKFEFKAPIESDELIQFELLKSSDNLNLYKSKTLKSNEVITEIKLKEELLVGSHQISFKISLLDKETKKEKETKTYAISLLVENH